MPIHAVFFDLDDTLLDTTGSRRARAERIFEHLTARYPRAPDDTLLRLDRDIFIARALATDPATGWSLGVERMLEELAIHDTDLGRECLGMWFFQGCFDLARCLPGATEAITFLASEYKLGVITNGLDSIQRAKFEALGVHRHFDVFVTSERAGAEKPAAQIFRLALQEAGVPPREAAFVGDRLDTDVLGARQAGMHAIWLDHAGRCPPGIGPEPHASILGLEELPIVLEQLS